MPDHKGDESLLIALRPCLRQRGGLKSRQARALRQPQQAPAHPRLSNPLRADQPVTLGAL
jgi:hypothetical protein